LTLVPVQTRNGGTPREIPRPAGESDDAGLVKASGGDFREMLSRGSTRANPGKMMKAWEI